MKMVTKNIKVIIAFVIGLIISGVSTYALTVASKDVTYNNTNVESAINDLYSKVSSGKLNGLVMPQYTNYSSSSTNFGNKTTLWTNNTGKDITLYYQGVSLIAGNAANPEGYFQTTDGTILYTFNWASGNSYGYEDISFVVPNGKTLELYTRYNYGRFGILSEYPLSSNTPISSN